MFLFFARPTWMQRGTQGHVDATWHSGPRGSATRAHAAPTRRYIYIFTIII